MQRSFFYYVIRFIGGVFIFCVFAYGASFLLARFAPEMAAVIFEGPGALGIAIALFIMPPLTVGQAFYKFEHRRVKAGDWHSCAACCSWPYVAGSCGGR